MPPSTTPPPSNIVIELPSSHQGYLSLVLAVAAIIKIDFTTVINTTVKSS